MYSELRKEYSEEKKVKLVEGFWRTLEFRKIRGESEEEEEEERSE